MTKKIKEPKISIITTQDAVVTKKEEEKLHRELGREPTQWDKAEMWEKIRRDKKGSSTQEVDEVVQKIVSIILIFVTYGLFK